MTDWPLTPFGRLAVSDETMARMARKHRVWPRSRNCERRSTSCA